MIKAFNKLKKQGNRLIIILVFILASCTKENPELFTLTGNGLTFNSATLYWNNVIPDAEHITVKIYLKDSLVALLEDKWYYKLTNLTENTSYSGHIEVMNLASNASTTLLFSFTTLKNKPPENFTASFDKISGSSISLNWSQPFDPDGDSITYSLFLNKLQVAENLRENYHILNNLSPLTKYTIGVVASDNQGNEVKLELHCTTRAKGAELAYRHGKFGGIERAYGLYKPSGTAAAKLPLFINLHGWGGFVWPQMENDYYPTLAEREKFIFLAPQGSLYADGMPGWSSDDSKDLNYISELMDSMLVYHNADAERIYLSGMSNGAFMTYFLARALQDQLAAVAPIAGTLGYSQYNSYTLRKPMPLCHIHGTADSVVQVQGNKTHVSFEKMLEFFIPNNKVNPTPRITELADINSRDNSTVTKFEYYAIDGSGADIVYYRINNGNHSVPGVQSSANKDINGCEEIWKFFSTRTLSAR